MARLRDVLESCNRLLAPWDELLSRPTDDDAAPLFIVGPPRSGTTLTYQVITQQLRVAYFTAPFGYLYGAPRALAACIARYTRRPRPVFVSRHGRIPGVLAPSEHASFWFQWFPRDGVAGQYIEPASFEPDDYGTLRRAVAGISRIAGRPFVFKNVYLTMTAGALARIFPQARFVIVRRDLAWVALSLLKARESRGVPGEWWSVRPPHYREWTTMPLWQQIARQVHSTDHIVRRDLTVHASGRTIEIGYEDLCARPRAVVAEVADHLADQGYEAYADWRCPESFAAAERTGEPSARAMIIRAYIDRLEKDDAGNA